MYGSLVEGVAVAKASDASSEAKNEVDALVGEEAVGGSGGDDDNATDGSIGAGNIDIAGAVTETDAASVCVFEGADASETA